MSLQLVDKEDCSTKGGMRKTDRRKLEYKKQTKYHRERPKNSTYIDPVLGIVRVKNISCTMSLNGWIFRFSKIDKKEFDQIECRCFDENGDKERTYLIPKDKIIIDSFFITRKYKGERWYDKYIIDEL